MLKILFVCTGNTCRSPMAEAVFRHEAVKNIFPFSVDVSSAGLAAFAGEEATEHVRQLLGSEGIDIRGHRALKVNSDLVDESDLILTMTRSHYSQLVACFPNAAPKTYLLKEFAGENDSGSEIEDPIGSGLEKYQQVLEEIRVSIKKIILKLKESYR